MLAQKADLKTKDKDGLTPLHFANIQDHQGVAKLLVRHKADIGLEDSRGKTPLDFAAQNKQNEVVPLLRRSQATEEQARIWVARLASLSRLNVDSFKKLRIENEREQEAAAEGCHSVAEAISKLEQSVQRRPLQMPEVEQNYFDALKLLVVFSHRLGGVVSQKMLAITKATKVFVEQHDADFLLRTRYARLYSSVVANLKGFEWMFCFADDDWLGGEEYPYATSKDNKKIGWSPAAEIYCLRLYIDEGLVEESWPTQPEAD